MWQPLHRLPFPGSSVGRKRNRFEEDDDNDDDEEEAYANARLNGYDAAALRAWRNGTFDTDDDYNEDDEDDDDSPANLAMYGLLPAAVRDIEGEEYVEKFGMKFGHSSIQGHRPTNEDAHLIDAETLGEGHVIAAIFDGHAGPDAAIFVSENLVRILSTDTHWIEYSNLPNQKSKSKNVEMVKKALMETFQKLDDELHNSDQVQYGIDNSGCTAVCCIITPSHIICASVGDSRAVVMTKNEDDVHATPLTDDHKPQNKLEKKRICDAGGFVYMERVRGELAMSRAIGDFQYKENKEIGKEEQMVISIPDVSIHERSADDAMLLIACDGVFDVFDNYQAIQRLNTLREEVDRDSSIEKKEQKLSEAIINTALDNGSTDNISAIVVSF